MSEPTLLDYLIAVGVFPWIGLAWCGYLGIECVRFYRNQRRD